jgi:hypothetical protein
LFPLVWSGPSKICAGNYRLIPTVQILTIHCEIWSDAPYSEACLIWRSKMWPLLCVFLFLFLSPDFAAVASAYWNWWILKVPLFFVSLLSLFTIEVSIRFNNIFWRERIINCIYYEIPPTPYFLYYIRGERSKQKHIKLEFLVSYKFI